MSVGLVAFRQFNHLREKPNSKHRLAYLNFVEPTLKEPHIEIFTKDKDAAKKDYIKSFTDGNNEHIHMPMAQDNDTIFRTLPQILTIDIYKVM
ncbi:hypothetical protein [Helicobacter cetorum]|uniref:Uncharacterized protein n=1 Tax=Helicobacter cetorum (strain ATCC BAA-540 / CCUG 52418 / MIT 99-5656) TaxID=1163745 RepID=I0EQ62_HELCM|nr:hypothetical protein [Helicobacter cetorum]AFI05081.1 hypothetical protein HCD_00245 [Helicobacter cetorum MIT 99-5656]